VADNERSAVDLAGAVRAGRLTASAVVEDHLAAIELDDATIHAFNTVMADEAREAAGRIDAAVAEGRDPGPR
jgi:Asp-tRNA(Asn)/Glu-tRNA(Gln) amidotransferase A subunit family amidase